VTSDNGSTPDLSEWAVTGTHDFILDLLQRVAPPPRRALDLGAGAGGLTNRMLELGYDCVAADEGADRFLGRAKFHPMNLNDHDFASRLPGPFDLVTSIEVIEHLNSPIGFLTQIRSLLTPNGLAVISTPNVENAAARLKFFLTGKLRMMDAGSEWHISPIFIDLMVRQYLPATGFRLVEHLVFPSDDFPQTARRWLVPPLKLLGSVLKGPALVGDTNVFVLAPK
jgi:SAM-dependent methyltransferase